MYIIVPRERSTERFLGESAYGPYTSFEEAFEEADTMQMRNELESGNRAYDYIVLPLVSLQKV